MYSIGCIALVEVHHGEQQSGHERLLKHSLLLTRLDGCIRLPDIPTDTDTDSTSEFHKPMIIFPPGDVAGASAPASTCLTVAVS